MVGIRAVKAGYAGLVKDPGGRDAFPLPVGWCFLFEVFCDMPVQKFCEFAGGLGERLGCMPSEYVACRRVRGLVCSSGMLGYLLSR